MPRRDGILVGCIECRVKKLGEQGRSSLAPLRWRYEFYWGLGAVEVFFVEGFVLVVQGRKLAFDKKVADLGGQLQGIAGGDDDVGDLAGVEGADLIGEAQDLGGVERD